MSKTLTFGGVSSKDLFLINEISRSLLPPLEVPTITIPQRPGAVGYRSNIGVRSISVRITILGETEQEIREKIRTVASWAFSHEDKKLILSDDPDVFINARLSDQTDLDELAKIGEATLQFIALDPFYYRNTELSLLMNGKDTTFLNVGTYKTFPTIRMMAHGTGTNVKITNTRNDKHILLSEITAWKLYISEHENNSFHSDDGVREFDILDITSEFFALEPGENRILVTLDQDIQVDVRFIYRERYL